MSNQDFFFDDEQPADAPAEKPTGKGAPEPAAASKPAAPAPRPKTVAPAAQSVTMTVAGLIGVVSLLVGVIIGILVPAGGAEVGSPVGGTMPGAGTVAPSEQARPLTPEELQGGMPDGHPDIGGMTGGQTTPTPDGAAVATPTPDGGSE